jgi:hypothetical protein
MVGCADVDEVFEVFRATWQRGVTQVFSSDETTGVLCNRTRRWREMCMAFQAGVVRESELDWAREVVADYRARHVAQALLKEPK